MLESFENQPWLHETYVELLKHYKPDEDTICQIVGFKFQQSASVPSDIGSALDSLYKMTSYLLKHRLVDLDALLVHLTPSDEQCVQACKDDMEAARQYAKKLSSIQLSGPASGADSALPMPGDKSGGDQSNATGGTRLLVHIRHSHSGLTHRPIIKCSKLVSWSCSTNSTWQPSRPARISACISRAV